MQAAEPVALDVPPMEAETVEILPAGNGWQFEPKYDGFRCIAHRRGERVHLQSKNQKPLERYFPELAQALGQADADCFVLDGEIIIPDGTFETLQLRLHPAASRVKMLSQEHPAELVAFDMLARNGTSFLDRPFAERRAELEDFVRCAKPRSVQLGRAAKTRETARRWLGQAGLDGVMAKRLDLPYQAGARAMQKFKVWTTVDCVVAGIYWKSGTRFVEHLLLGLYDQDGDLHYVGRARVQDDGQMGRLLDPLIGGQGFTGRAPGGKSRWSGKERKPVPLDPVLVVEVSADHVTGDHMRHGARLLRWRTDKSPESCTIDQIR